MVSSMTGYGRAEASDDGHTARVEVRSVNSRYLEVNARLPRALSQRERDVKELVRAHLNRGNVNVTVKVEYASDGAANLRVNAGAARSYYRLLNEVRKAVKLKEPVKLQHLLNFSDILEPEDADESDEQEWRLVGGAIAEALRTLNTMRAQEGSELAADLEKRIAWLTTTLDTVETMSKDRLPEERQKLQDRVAELVQDKNIIDQNRLELEIALLSDKLDVTEECVRFRSHNKFFLQALRSNEPAGRKLNFLIQEMNREVNTIGSKANDAAIAQLVVQMKEELEKVREQLQNIE